MRTVGTHAGLFARACARLVLSCVRHCSLDLFHLTSTGRCQEHSLRRVALRTSSESSSRAAKQARSDRKRPAVFQMAEQSPKLRKVTSPSVPCRALAEDLRVSAQLRRPGGTQLGHLAEPGGRHCERCGRRIELRRLYELKEQVPDPAWEQRGSGGGRKRAHPSAPRPRNGSRAKRHSTRPCRPSKHRARRPRAPLPQLRHGLGRPPPPQQVYLSLRQVLRAAGHSLQLRRSTLETIAPRHQHLRGAQARRGVGAAWPRDEGGAPAPGGPA